MTQTQTSSPDRVFQIGEIAKLCGLPANAPTADIIAALERKAATTRDQGALWAAIGKLIAIPSNLTGSPLRFVTDAIRMIANRAEAQAPIVNRAKGALRDAIIAGSLAINDTDAHRRWFESLTSGRVDAALLNSARPRVDADNPPVTRKFVAAVRAEQAAGATKAQAVDTARLSDPAAHAAWIQAGGGSL